MTYLLIFPPSTTPLAICRKLRYSQTETRVAAFPAHIYLSSWAHVAFDLIVFAPGHAFSFLSSLPCFFNMTWPWHRCVCVCVGAAGSHFPPAATLVDLRWWTAGPGDIYLCHKLPSSGQLSPHLLKTPQLENNETLRCTKDLSACVFCWKPHFPPSFPLKPRLC